MSHSSDPHAPSVPPPPVPDHCVVDTNVAVTANGANDAASHDCATAAAAALDAIMRSGHVYIDDGGLIVDEYRRNLLGPGEPRAGQRFFKWLLTNEWGARRVTRVAITQKPQDETDFEELPAPPEGVSYDPSDRKFLAVSAAHGDRPPVLQTLDSKWWGWKEALAASGVTIHFLCEEEIARLHAAKSKD